MKKHVSSFSEYLAEGLWDSWFGKASVDRAAHDAKRGQGWSHRGRDAEQEERHWVEFDGQRFYDEDIEYDDYNSTKPVPRVEDGKLIVANPAWES